MEVFANDFILGEFRASDYGLVVASFSSSGESEYEIGFTPAVIEKFVGQEPVPVYLGQKYEEKLQPTITIIKNPCIYQGKDLNFSEKELRNMAREFTGIKGYQWLKIINDTEDNIWYRARINKLSYKRVRGYVVGLILELMCDSCFAWSEEYDISINAKANKKFFMFNNTDDFNSYVYPVVELSSIGSESITLTNLTDNNRETEIINLKGNEKITIDSKNEIISSSIEHSLLLDDFNLHWVRLVPEKNEYISNVDAMIRFKFRVPRKIGFN